MKKLKIIGRRLLGLIKLIDSVCFRVWTVAVILWLTDAWHETYLLHKAVDSEAVDITAVAALFLVCFAFLAYLAGREGRICPKRYNSALNTHKEFVTVASDFCDTQDIRLANAKVLLRQQASLMPDCSRKTALFAEIDAL